MAKISLRGKTINTFGDLPAVGTKAPGFVLVNGKLQDKTLADFAGKKLVLNVVPSLDTPVCAISTKQFNELMSGRDDVVLVTVSADLPFAQGRFCGAEKLKDVQPLSMMRSRNFAKDYGVLMLDGPLAGITARAVLVLDEHAKVLHAELVADVAQEPDYDAVIKILAA